MDNYEKDKPNNYLNEYSYEQLKKVNKKALNILEEFVSEIKVMFLDINKYISKPNKLLYLLEQIQAQGIYNYQKVELCMELSVNEQNERHDGTKEVYRYYYRDTGIIIYNSIHYKESILKMKNKKINTCFTVEGIKESNRLEKITSDKLKKLQNKLFYLIDNDPTIEDSEDEKIVSE